MICLNVCVVTVCGRLVFRRTVLIGWLRMTLVRLIMLIPFFVGLLVRVVCVLCFRVVGVVRGPGRSFTLF